MADDEEAFREHARRAGMPDGDVLPIGGPVVIRADPG
ncbi:MAG: DUF4242 domain-containing protein [Rhodobacterales bacterium]|nr:DUF4242 domain-containing protein [Rhodobacterales bacterium]